MRHFNHAVLPTILVALVMTLSLTCLAGWEFAVYPEQKQPCNIFWTGTPVSFESQIKARVGGKGTAVVKAVDFWGRTVKRTEHQLDFPANKALPLTLDFGKLPVGYYEAVVEGRVKDNNGKVHKETRKFSFGVAERVERTAAEALAQNSRFGMKLWMVGEIWWNRKLTWKPDMVTDVWSHMGLQWTRALLQQKNYMDTQVLMRDYPVNVVLKMEHFPESCFDSARYGDFEAFKKKFKAWSKCSVPKEQAYKEWIKGLVKTVPANQRVFEIWNEPWQWHKTMSAEDFAKVCQWTCDAVKEVRPDAIVGPNIYGATNTYDLTVMDSGGLDKAGMVAIHPYTAGTPEAKKFRRRLRNYHDLIKMKLGHDLPLYSTEYGWSTSPRGDRSVSEQQQAQYTVRESLMLYAEDVKTLIPHTMGQREQDPKEREHYFGFFRLNHEPKPVIMAFAQCAKLIDSSRFVGDLWYGKRIGAMLFEKKGVYTLALWTEGEDKRITIDTKAESVTLIDLMGNRKEKQTRNGKLALKLDGDVVYVQGVGAGLANEVIKPGDKLTERWNVRAESHTMPKMTVPPVIDGKLDDWTSVKAQLLDTEKMDDIAALWRMAWDDENLYVAVQVKDKRIFNDRLPQGISFGDCVDLFICSRPERQVGKDDIYDFEFRIAPTCKEGRPAFSFANAVMGHITDPAVFAKKGIEWRVNTQHKGWQGSSNTPGWVAEAKIPFAAIGLEKAEAGKKLSFNLVVFDRDKDDPKEWKTYNKRLQVFKKKKPAYERPYLILGR